MGIFALDTHSTPPVDSYFLGAIQFLKRAIGFEKGSDRIASVIRGEEHRLYRFYHRPAMVEGKDIANIYHRL